ncbi:hypothetical protein [Mesoterricola silvestris]|uniref:Uncharacterized protein n=1 Tax=Mesoterricola silvestris TaxID=2927979 RepID=A0AA48KBS3_9BACT|nr:hypothetical protein [Mesoterricola silvestris]BDU74617.1 hypothetical protein METEAL_37910 [Mesoterricola silvestris]
MKIPENLREIVDRLGSAMVQALAKDEETRALARAIQDKGFDIALVLEATVALHRREEEEDTAPGFTLPGASEDDGQWSESDKAFLRTFRISM